MWVILVTALILSSLSFVVLCYPRSNALKLSFFGFVTVLLVVISGGREIGVGQDDLAYTYIFDDVVAYDLYTESKEMDGFEAQRIEKGFVAVIALMKMFTLNNNYIFMMFALIVVSLNSFLFYKISPNFYLCQLVYLSHFFLYKDMNQLRTALASAICLLLIVNFYKLKKYFFIVGVASTIHLASLSYILLPLVRKLFLNKKTILFFLLFSIVLSQLSLFSLILPHIPGGSYITNKIIGYSSSSVHGAKISFFDLTNLKNIFFYLLVMFYWDRISTIRFGKEVAMFFCVGVLWRLAFLDFSILAARVSVFFTFTEPVLLSLLPFVTKYKNAAIFFVIIYSFAMLLLNIFVKGVPNDYSLFFI